MNEHAAATRTEVPVVWVEQAGPIGKSAVPWSKTPGYAAPIRYHLADGTTVDSKEMASRKKDVTAAVAVLPSRPKNPTWATFRDGEYIGTQTAFWIGAGATAEWLHACETFDASRSGADRADA